MIRRPAFIDIEPATFNMNVDLLEIAITPCTKAIMPVSLLGQMPDYEQINTIAASYGNIPVIGDGAQSFGATQHGRCSCGVTAIVPPVSFWPNWTVLIGKSSVVMQSAATIPKV